MAASFLSILLLVSSVALGFTQEQTTTTTCNLSVDIDFDGEQFIPTCFNQCSDDQTSLWYDGVMYKRTPEMEQSQLMVEVQFVSGALVECKVVPFKTDEQLLAEEAEIMSCLGFDSSSTAASTTSQSTTPAGPVLKTSTRCPAGFMQDGGSCYLMTPTVGTQGEGEKFCQEKGGELAIVDNKEEQDKLAYILPAGIDVFIGFTDRATEGLFVDVHNRRPAFNTSWDQGQPDNGTISGNGKENCVIMRSETNFMWADTKCATPKRRSLCEASSQVYEHYSCLEGDLELNGVCYFTVDDVNYKEAKTFCGAAGGQLAFVSSQEIQDFLAARLDANKSVMTAVNDRKNEGRFVATNYGLPIFTNWGVDEPVEDDALDCTILNHNDGFNWAAVDCDQKQSALCEIEAPTEA